MNVLNQLQHIIQEKPTLVQVCINGVWEETWDIPYDAGMPPIEAIDEYLSHGTEALAFELFYKTVDGYNVILGVRYKDGLKTLSPREFLIKSFESLWSDNDASFTETISKLNNYLIQDSDKLFEIPPTGVELGVINWWKSMGSIEIWHRDESKIMSASDLQDKLNNAPHLLKNSNNYVAMELNYNVIPHYWIGIQVSDEQAGSFVLNEKRLEDLLQNLLEISIRR